MSDNDSEARRAMARERPESSGTGGADLSRSAFFDGVYRDAQGDAAAVPWADMEPKPQLLNWLSDHPGRGRRAVDIACGLGDNAAALDAAGWQTTAFDYVEKAVSWARQRFTDRAIDWHVADLLNLPLEWRGAFDLVNECYTVQSVPPEHHAEFSAAIASLVAPGGTLLVYARSRGEGTEASGPPWPLMPSELDVYASSGLKREASDSFEIQRPGKMSPHRFDVWRRL